MLELYENFQEAREARKVEREGEAAMKVTEQDIIKTLEEAGVRDRFAVVGNKGLDRRQLMVSSEVGNFSVNTKRIGLASGTSVGRIL